MIFALGALKQKGFLKMGNKVAPAVLPPYCAVIVYRTGENKGYYGRKGPSLDLEEIR
jgi:hypothetical protein